MESHARIMSKDSKTVLSVGFFLPTDWFGSETICSLTTPSENSMPSITFNPLLLLEMMNSIARFYYSLSLPMRELIQEY